MALAVLVTASFAWAGRSVDPATVAYAFGPDYAGDVLTPSADAAIGRPYILRDYRGVAVRWNPFRYNPATGTLRVHDETTIEIATAGISARNVLERGRIASRPVRAFADLYRDHFMNYSERQAFAPSSRIDEEGEMLVICHDAWVANLAPLVTHKWGRGITTTVIPVSEIGNDAVSIKNYIQNYYATRNLAFVLLVGDSAQVATPLLNGYDAADPTYAKIAGADDYPDVFVGRISAQTVAQVDTQIARTIDYEPSRERSGLVSSRRGHRFLQGGSGDRRRRAVGPRARGRDPGLAPRRGLDARRPDLRPGRDRQDGGERAEHRPGHRQLHRLRQQRLGEAALPR
jgi:hypothetical protein